MLVFQINLGLAALGAEQRRLRDIEITGLDQRTHMPEEEGQKKRADVASVDIGIRHDDDLVIARLLGLHLVVPDACPDGRDQRADLGRGKHLVGACPLDIQDLAAKGKNGLVGAVTTLLGGTARRITLDKKDFGFGRIALLAIRQLAGKAGDFHHALAAGQIARLARRLACRSGLVGLGDDLAGIGRVFLEPLVEAAGDGAVHHRLHL